MRPSMLILLLLTFAMGCSDKPKPVAKIEPKALPTEPVNTDIVVDSTIPRLKPKPVVWLKDWKEPAALEPARVVAAKLTAEADKLKSAKAFEKAEKAYQLGMKADPTWAYPWYQLACNYELWGKHEQALTHFQKAMELGYDDFPTILEDDELGQIRHQLDFGKSLSEVRERYILSNTEKLGQAVAFKPEGNPPAGGWPVMLMLHGYGDTNVSFFDEGEEWAKLGFVAVAVPGSVPMGRNQYQWTRESIEPTHEDLQEILKSPLLKSLINPDKVSLFGFSQGGQHALLLTAESPTLYRGVIAMSPGGAMSEKMLLPALKTGTSAKVFFVYGTKERHAPVAAVWSTVCKDAGWKFEVRTHPGGHTLPANWDVDMRDGAAKFLK